MASEQATATKEAEATATKEAEAAAQPKQRAQFCSSCGGGIKLGIPEGDDQWRHICQSCGEVHFFNPKLVVGCIVESGGRVLLCKRAIDPCKGKWTLPAGYLELGESTAGTGTPCIPLTIEILCNCAVALKSILSTISWPY